MVELDQTELRRTELARRAEPESAKTLQTRSIPPPLRRLGRSLGSQPECRADANEQQMTRVAAAAIAVASGQHSRCSSAIFLAAPVSHLPARAANHDRARLCGSLLRNAHSSAPVGQTKKETVARRVFATTTRARWAATQSKPNCINPNDCDHDDGQDGNALAFCVCCCCCCNATAAHVGQLEIGKELIGRRGQKPARRVSEPADTQLPLAAQTGSPK